MKHYKSILFFVTGTLEIGGRTTEQNLNIVAPNMEMAKEIFNDVYPGYEIIRINKDFFPAIIHIPFTK